MNGTHIVSFSLFGEWNSLPPMKGDEGYSQLFVCMWFVSVILLAGCSKLFFSHVAPNVVHSFMMLFGWLFGYTFHRYVKRNWFVRLTNEKLILNCLPILFYYSTLRVDYHTLVSSIGLIVVVALPVILYHYGIILLISYTILNEKFRWDWQVLWLFAVDVGVIQVEHCVVELNRVQGQMRVLQLVLLGERFASFAIASIIHNTIDVYYNPNQPRHPESSIMWTALGWTLFSILVAVIYAYIFRWMLTYFYKDIVSQTTMTVAAVYLLFWSLHGIKANGALAVLVFGITLGYSKIKYSSAAERFFGQFWTLVYFAIIAIIMSTVGLYLGAKPHWVLIEMFGFVFLVYILLIMSRALGFITVYPFIKRYGFQITMKHLVIATIGVSRSSVALVYAFMDRHFAHGYSLVLFCAVIFLASTFFNVVLLHKYLAFFEMYKMSRSRLVNMNVALAQVNGCREKSIRSLKMDRLIADSNWIIVDQITQLPHPYADIMDDPKKVGHMHKEDASTKGVKTARYLKCRECAAENEIPPTLMEYNDMLLEAKQRILKAQLVCFWKQHENGTLTRQGVTVLNNLIESAAVREDPRLSYKDLKIQREGTKTLRCLKQIFGMLFTITSVTHRFIPTNIIRALCFRLCTLRSYKTLMACLCLIDIVIVIGSLRTYYSSNDPESHVALSHFFQTCDAFFFTLFTADFLINILGTGTIQYFLVHVNKIEFAAGLLIRGNQLLMFLHTCYVANKIVNVFTASPTIFVQKACMLVRVSRVYVFIVALIPKIMVMIDKKLDSDLIRSYDIGKAYLISLNRIAYFLNHIADNDAVYQELMNDVETDRYAVTRELGLIQRDRPTIAISNKTLHAIRHVIICMGDCISSMKDEGLLDPSENRSLLTSLEKVKKRLLTFSLVEPTLPDHILFAVPWLSEDPETILFFLKHAKLSSYQQGDQIIYYGDDCVGLYILVSGMVKVCYKSSEKAVKDNKVHGVLPNCDYYTKLIFETSQYELIVSGNLLGELGIVSGRRYDMEVYCETRVQLYYIPWSILRVVIHDSGNAAFIQAKIWKTIGIRIALHLLHNTAKFQGWQDYKLLLYLQRSVVPLLDGVESLHISDYVDDIILIEGKVMDYASRGIFTAPMCIPRISSQRLILPGTTMWDTKAPCSPKILVVPNSEAEIEDIMSNEGIFKYTYQSGAYKQNMDECDQHSPHSYVSRLVQSQRRRRMVTSFMDYMPTAEGPVEGLVVSSTYIEKRGVAKAVKAGAHPRTRFIPNFANSVYTQDIEEESEIEQLKDADEDEDESEMSTGKRSSRKGSRAKRKSRLDSRKKSSAVSLGERYSSYYQSYSKGDANKRAEILFVEDSEDVNEVLERNSKPVQTLLTTRFRSESPIPPPSK